MKKIKIVLIAFVLILSTSLIVGCTKVEEEKTNQNDKVEEKSIAVMLSEQFQEEIKKEKDIEKVANTIAQNKVLEISTDVVVLNKSAYISGFQTEIKDFKKAVTISPIIGTIPFVAYIFEVDDAERYAENLKQNADLRWNICTEADDLEVTVVDNYIFFIMSPTNFDAE